MSAADSVAAWCRYPPVGGASMEPRRVSPGNPGGRLGVVIWGELQWSRGLSAAESGRGQLRGLLDERRASMEPRLVSRGIGPSGWFPPTGLCGFNGAAACQPRNHSDEQRYVLPWCSASMEPRLVSRGIELQARRRGAVVVASMEPRLVSRGIADRFPDEIRIGVLQWSRGLSAAESGLGGVSPAAHVGASMEPRLVSRGIRVVATGHSTWRIASMEPRRVSRGIPKVAGLSYRDVWLQWSRGLSAAESAGSPSILLSKI